MKLPKLTSKDMRYENKYGYDRLYSELTLTDTDWMNYKLTARFNTKYGRFFLSFEYFGADFSTLKATLQNESRTDTYTYEYSTDLFKKYIVRFLTDQINAWKTSSVFYAEKLVLDFYNEVLTLLSI